MTRRASSHHLKVMGFRPWVIYKYDENYWKSASNSGEVNAWSGVAFERVCLEHLPQIKKALGISGVQTDVNSWRCEEDSEKGLQGPQIDLLIVRKDQVINVFEMKYCKSDFSPGLAFDKDMRRRIADLGIATKTKYAIHSTLITTYEVKETSYYGNIQAVITADKLFD